MRINSVQSFVINFSILKLHLLVEIYVGIENFEKGQICPYLIHTHIHIYIYIYIYIYIVRTQFVTTHNNVEFAHKKAQIISFIERGFEMLGLGHQTVDFSWCSYMVKSCSF